LLSLFVTGQGQRASAPEALLGFDPIEIIGGAETLGQESLASEYEGLRYLFVSAANKARFDADPGRYAMQLGRTCARMGAPVGAGPDEYVVHDGRIYGFGSAECLKLFKANPTAYLAAPVPKPVGPTTAAARQLIDKAVAAHGSALVSIGGWTEKGIVMRNSPMGPVEAPFEETTMVSPFRFRQAQTLSFNGQAQVITTEVTDTTGTRTTPRGTVSLVPGGAASLREAAWQHPIALLRRASAPDAALELAGDGEIGGTAVSFVRLWSDGMVTDLAIASDGHVAALRFSGRGPDGTVGEIVRAFPKAREVSGILWPVTVTATFNGTPDPSREREIREIVIAAGAGRP
jgi:YHS domain-containing protein